MTNPVMTAHEYDEDVWNAMFDNHVVSTFATTKAYLNAVREVLKQDIETLRLNCIRPWNAAFRVINGCDPWDEVGEIKAPAAYYPWEEMKTGESMIIPYTTQERARIFQHGTFRQKAFKIDVNKVDKTMHVKRLA